MLEPSGEAKRAGPRASKTRRPVRTRSNKLHTQAEAPCFARARNRALRHRRRARSAHALLHVCLVALTLLATSAARADRETCIAAHEEAQVMRMRGRYSAAREQLLICAQAGCPQLISSDCIALMSEVEASLSTVVFAVSDAHGQDLIDVRVLSDGKLLSQRLDGRAIAIDPGVHELAFEAPGYARATHKVTVVEAQKRRLIQVQLVLDAGAAARPQAHPRDSESELVRRRYLASYVLWGGAAAALGAGIALGVLGKKELDRLEESCGGVCSKRDVSPGKRLYIGADVAFALAGGMTVAATWLYFATRKKRAQQRDELARGPSGTFTNRLVLLGWRETF
jgi:hypothetical protein